MLILKKYINWFIQYPIIIWVLQTESTILDICSVKHFQAWQWLDALIQGIDSGASGAKKYLAEGEAPQILWGESMLSTSLHYKCLCFQRVSNHPRQKMVSPYNSVASSTYDVLISSCGLGASAAGSSLETKVHPRLLAELRCTEALMCTSLKSEMCHQGFLKKWCRGTRWLP